MIQWGVAMADETAITLPKRSGEPPNTRLAMPHQQLDQTPPTELQDELLRRMAALGGVRLGRSGVSLPESRALHLDPPLARGPAEAFMVGTEFAHLHGPRDGSLHAMLPASTAAEAIDKGWAELHPLARDGTAPPTLLMLYGPRDKAELETVWQLVEASYAFACGRTGLIECRAR
jgi:hypothetical protein